MVSSSLLPVLDDFRLSLPQLRPYARSGTDAVIVIAMVGLPLASDYREYSTHSHGAQSLRVKEWPAPQLPDKGRRMGLCREGKADRTDT